MNQYGVLTTKQELEECCYSEFETLKEEGTFLLLLHFRSWTRSNGLICYFTDCTSDNYSDYRFVKLYCWRHGEIYNPKQCQIDMSRVKDGTLWEVELKKNRKGNVEWVGAKLVRGGDY